MNYFIIVPGSTVVQRPRAKVVYSLLVDDWGIDPEIAIERALPNKFLDTLTIVPMVGGVQDRTLIEVSEGVAGANYYVRCGLKAFTVRISSTAEISAPQVPVAPPPVAPPPRIDPLPLQQGPRTRQRN